MVDDYCNDPSAHSLSGCSICQEEIVQKALLPRVEHVRLEVEFRGV